MSFVSAVIDGCGDHACSICNQVTPEERISNLQKTVDDQSQCIGVLNNELVEVIDHNLSLTDRVDGLLRANEALNEALYKSDESLSEGARIVGELLEVIAGQSDENDQLRAENDKLLALVQFADVVINVLAKG